MVLDRLPNELQVDVLRQLRASGDCGGADLASVALCSHRYYNLALPILYSEFNACVSATPSFLRTILDRPDLALYVKRLTGYEPDGRGKWCRGPQERIDTRLRHAIAQACEDEMLRKEWYFDFYDRKYPDAEHWGRYANWDAVTALLLLYLPNLTALKIPCYTGQTGVYFFQKPIFISFVFRQAAELQHAGVQSAYSLKKLCQLEITCDWQADLVSLESTYTIMALPSIRQVHCPNTVRVPNRLGDDEEPAHVPHVTHLSFPQSNMRTVPLARFIRPFTRLTHFSYVLSCRANPYPFIPHIIWKGLLHLKDTLQELILVASSEEYQHIDTYYGPAGWYEHKVGNRSERPLGSLTEFRFLRRLEVTAVALLGRGESSEDVEWLDVGSRDADRAQRVANSLPESLETLVLHSCDGDVYETIGEVFQTRLLGRLGRLKTITLLFLKHFSAEQILMDERGLACELEGENIGVTVNRLGFCRENITFKILE